MPTARFARYPVHSQGAASCRRRKSGRLCRAGSWGGSYASCGRRRRASRRSTRLGALEWSVTKLWRLGARSAGDPLARRANHVRAVCRLTYRPSSCWPPSPRTPKTRAGGTTTPTSHPGLSCSIGLEEAACRLREYHVELVPGLFQTRQYATAIFTKGVSDPDEIERRVAIRMKRARLLTRLDPAAPEVTVVLNEAVLRQVVGGPAGAWRHSFAGWPKLESCRTFRSA